MSLCPDAWFTESPDPPFLAPTALALTMSLLGTGLPRGECRKHIAAFAASTPIGSLLTFGILSLVGATAGADSDWTGIALLLSVGLNTNSLSRQTKTVGSFREGHSFM